MAVAEVLGWAGSVAVATALGVSVPVAAQERPATGGMPTLTLEEAVRTALDRNPRLQAARFGLEESREQVSEAWGNVMPAVDLTASFTRNVSPSVNFLPAIIFDPEAGPHDLIPVRFGADNIWSNAINVEQPLFNAAAFIGVGAAGRFSSLQEEVVRGERQSVVTEVREVYYALLLAQEQLRLTENSVRRVRETLDESRALHRAGLASEYDVLRLEVELANLEPNVRRARNTMQQHRRELGIQLALDADRVEELVVEGSLASMRLADPTANSPENRAILAFGGELPTEAPALVETALVERSDVRQLELTRSLRQTELRLEQVQYLPRISLFGNYTINAQQNGGPDFFGGPRAYGRNVGVQVTLPIFQGFQRDARIDQRRAVVRQAEVQTDLARDRAQSDVRTLLEQMDEARARAMAQERAVGQAQRGFEIARAENREGLGSRLELTDAEVALRQSEFNYAQAVFDYLVSRARLDAATGRVPGVGEGF